jgi:anti-sigma regulatory factor (Ser/Thr protein kinase)/transcriptional regulator with XRE-family HTH domain
VSTPTLLGSLAIPGRAENVRAARAFVARTLGDGHACTDSAVLLTSEMCANAIQHSRSGAGGQITISVIAIGGGIRVEVADQGGPPADRREPQVWPARERSWPADGRRAGLAVGLRPRRQWDRHLVRAGRADDRVTRRRMPEMPMAEPDPIAGQRRELGRRLAAARKAAGYSQRVFAGRIGYARSTLSTVESGVQRAGRSFWEACDRALRTAGTFADGYDLLRAAQADARCDAALGPGAESAHPGLRAAVLADAEPAYRAMGWPLVISDGRAELETGTVLDVLEVPQAAGALAACWWRHGGMPADPAHSLPSLPDPRRSLVAITCASRYFFLTMAGCCPLHGQDADPGQPPAGHDLLIRWHSAGSRIPAPPSADSAGQQAAWAHLPAWDIELACPVVLLSLLARAVAMTRSRRTVELPDGVRAILATSPGPQTGQG